MGLSLNHRRVLARFGFQNQNPADIFRMEIDNIRGLRDSCDEGAGNKALITRGKVHSIIKKVEKYARIGDLAMRRHPGIVALVWAALRMSLQVSRGSSCSVAQLY